MGTIGLLGGTSCATDNRLDEALSLTYTSAPLEQPTRIEGPIQASPGPAPSGCRRGRRAVAARADVSNEEEVEAAVAAATGGAGDDPGRG